MAIESGLRILEAQLLDQTLQRILECHIARNAATDRLEILDDCLRATLQMGTFWNFSKTETLTVRMGERERDIYLFFPDCLDRETSKRIPGQFTRHP